MKRLAAFALTVLLGLAAALAQAACPQSGGIGGTGKPSSGGMGGTGAPAPAELGLIGVLQAAGSTLCVNGVEVELDATTVVTANKLPVGAAALAPGQVVVVRGSATADKAHAAQIEILEAMTGSVSSFDASSGVLHIGAQRVQVTSGTAMAGLSRSSLGERPSVRVSGLWRADGSVEATRIEPAPPGAPARVSSRDFPDPGAQRLIVDGYVRSIQRSRVNVGGLTFELDARTASRLHRDERVRVRAHVEHGRRIVERAEPVAAAPERAPAPSSSADTAPARRDASADDRGRGGGEGVERGAAAERIERGASPERVERSTPERPERTDRSGPERPERVERNVGPDRPERLERNSGPDRPERNPGPERIERMDRSGPH